MGTPVTLSNGRYVEVTAANWRQLAAEDNAAYVAKFGDGVSTAAARAARLLHFEALGGQDTSYFTAPGAGAVAAAERVTGNPFVRAAETIRDGAGEAWSGLKAAAAGVPNTLSQASTTTRFVAVALTVVGVAVIGLTVAVVGGRIVSKFER